MHDCPGCQTPLHGHESYCPVCGTKQQIRAEYQFDNTQQQGASFNPFLIVLIMVVAGAGLFYAVQNSWIGELMRRGPVTEAEDTPATQLAAREKLENGFLQNLAGEAPTAKFKYTAEGKEVDRSYAGPVELSIEVRLKDPNKRRSLVDPIKALMVPAHITTLTLNETHSGAVATYSVSGGGSDDSSQANQEDSAAKSE